MALIDHEHHSSPPSGIIVEIVGIEANSNGRSCHQHYVRGSLVEEDVVLRLRKVQILNSLGREESDCNCSVPRISWY